MKLVEGSKARSETNTGAEIYDMVLNYYNSHEIAYPDEAADALNLDLRKVIEVVDKLIAENKIEVAA